jgi:hypothetical protein
MSDQTNRTAGFLRQWGQGIMPLGYAIGTLTAERPGCQVKVRPEGQAVYA